jgi:hypothetical protein
MALVATLWAFLLFGGIDGLLAIRSRHIVGYPATGQIIGYAVLPALALGFLALSAFLSRKARWFYSIYPFAVGIAAFSIFPLLFIWSGGV